MKKALDFVATLFEAAVIFLSLAQAQPARAQQTQQTQAPGAQQPPVAASKLATTPQKAPIGSATTASSSSPSALVGSIVEIRTNGVALTGKGDSAVEGVVIKDGYYVRKMEIHGSMTPAPKLIMDVKGKSYTISLRDYRNQAFSVEGGATVKVTGKIAGNTMYATKFETVKKPEGQVLIRSDIKVSSSSFLMEPGTQVKTESKEVPQSTLTTESDKVSYAIGMNIGKSLKRDGVEVDPAILLRALKDTIAGGKLLLTDQEAQTALTTLQAELRKKQEERMQQLADSNKKEGEAFLAANKTKQGVLTLPSGLQYKVLQEGTGPKPATTDTVLVNYRGTLLNGTEFDSSYKRGQPTPFAVGQIIKGWSEALQLMAVGSKWQLFIPSDLAYGPRSAGRDIGPNSTLLFEVELVSIQPKAAPAPAPAPTPAPNAALAPTPTPSPAPAHSKP